jgi:hypothetical protein
MERDGYQSRHPDSTPGYTAGGDRGDHHNNNQHHQDQRDRRDQRDERDRRDDDRDRDRDRDRKKDDSDFFPAGLLPGLAKNANHSADQKNGYIPINPASIDQSVPPPGPVNEYMTQRLDRFYEDLKDGGRTRLAEGKKEHEDGAREMERRDRSRKTLDQENRLKEEESTTGGLGMRADPVIKYDDGSGPGKRGMGRYSGLGATEDLGSFKGDLGQAIGMPQDGQDREAFETYRKQRAGHYHTLMSNPRTPVG